jgi:glycosyltransferase involved in cell wall biosynthesis
MSPNPLKIGFDAKRAFQNFTGLGNYARTLVETMAQYYPIDYDLHLYAPKINPQKQPDFLKESKNISIHTPQGIWKNVPTLWRQYGIDEALKKDKIQIYHGLSNELPKGIDRNIKKIVTIHDLIFERFPQYYPFIDRKIYHHKFLSACQNADLIVAISEQTKQDIIEFYKIDARRIHVVYQSCHSQFYHQESETLKQEDNLLISSKKGIKVENCLQKYQLPPEFVLYVGTINERKNLLNVVKAMQQVKDLPLVVIGDGKEYLAKVKQFIKENQLESRIFMRPRVAFEDLPSIYQAAKVFVYPSFFEGFGIPIIEALHSGTPVVTSKGSCFSEAGGADSIYIDPKNCNEIAEAVNLIVNSQELAQKMISKGYIYSERFLQKNIAKEWHTTYQLFS